MIGIVPSMSDAEWVDLETAARGLRPTGGLIRRLIAHGRARSASVAASRATIGAECLLRARSRSIPRARSPSPDQGDETGGAPRAVAPRKGRPDRRYGRRYVRGVGTTRIRRRSSCHKEPAPEPDGRALRAGLRSCAPARLAGAARAFSPPRVDLAGPTAVSELDGEHHEQRPCTRPSGRRKAMAEARSNGGIIRRSSCPSR